MEKEGKKAKKIRGSMEVVQYLLNRYAMEIELGEMHFLLKDMIFQTKELFECSAQ